VEANACGACVTPELKRSRIDGELKHDLPPRRQERQGNAKKISKYCKRILESTVTNFLVAIFLKPHCLVFLGALGVLAAK
jgi:hypothetical protein